MVGESVSRTLVVWCPDWPAVAAARQAGTPASGPVAVFGANRVRACTQAARADGVRIGMRRREAQSRCPELVVLKVDEEASGRLFEPVAAAVEEIAPGVEVLRPGMLACPARGPRRYFGSEEAAAERIIDAVEALDVEARVGMADQLPVAVLAARQQRIVPEGGSAEFCAGLSIVELSRDPAIAPPERAGLVDLLVRLGITTVGDFAALPAERVATRFGADALVAHELANGRAERGLSRRNIPTELLIEQRCDPPLDRVDTAAFLGRALAQRFHELLAGAGLACTRLQITAVTTEDRRLQRVWRSAQPLTPEATADRLRWQLDGWLTARRRSTGAVAPGTGAGTARAGSAKRARLPQGADRRYDADRTDDVVADTDLDFGSGPGAITLLRLEPVEAVEAGQVQYGLWGSDGSDDHRAGWAFARLQGLLGPEAVLAPVRSGGRSPADRISLVGWGDEKTPARDPAAPWPGALPAPSPTRIVEPRPVELADRSGRPVVMTPRGTLSAAPELFDGSRVTGWAGPWVIDERWWEKQVPADEVVSSPPAYSARMQISSQAGSVVLIRYRPGRARTNDLTAEHPGPEPQQRTADGCWQVEGVYD